MLDEASQELVGAQSHEPLLVAASVVFPAKRDLIPLVSDDPVIADRNAMSVTAEITEDRRRAAEGGFGVNHPVLAAESFHQRRKLLGCGESGIRAAKVEFLEPKSAAQSLDELTPADPAKNFDG